MKMAILGDHADVFNGKTPSKAEQRDTGHPVLKIRDVDDSGRFRRNYESFVDLDFVARFINKAIKAGDTLILNAAHNADYVGSKTFFADSEVEGAIATGEWLIVRPHSSALDARFACHWLTSSAARREVRELVKGIHLYPKDVARLSIPLPPLEEQKRIAAILDQADDLRRKRQRALDRLNQLGQAIFIEMFGDSNAESGWNCNVTELSRVCKKISDGTHQAPNWADSGIPFLFVSNIRNQRINMNTKKFVSYEEFEKLTKHTKIEPNDVLYTCVGSYGYTAVVDGSATFTFQRHIAHLKPNLAVVLPHYLSWCLETPKVKTQADKLATGIAQKTVTLSALKKFRVPIPILMAQKEFERRISRILRLRDVMELEASFGANLFTSLQHRAFRGEL